MKVSQQHLKNWSELIDRKFIYSGGSTLYQVSKVYVTVSGVVLLEIPSGGLFLQSNVDFIALEITK